MPLSDANQWRVVDEADDLLLPLSWELEHHAVRQATSLRIDDTGSMVVALARQIGVEVAALEPPGASILPPPAYPPIGFTRARAQTGHVGALATDRRCDVSASPDPTWLAEPRVVAHRSLV